MARRLPAEKPASEGKASPVAPKKIPDKVGLSLQFKMTFWAILGLTILSLAASFAMIWLRVDTPEAKSFVETCNSTWKMGVGAIIGMLAGRNLK